MAGFNQVRVNNSLDFVGGAANAPNMTGAMSGDKIYMEYNFTEKVMDATNRYTAYIDTDSAVALGAAGLTLTTLATDTRTCSMACGTTGFYAGRSPIVEMKFKVNVITTIAINAGFSDATSEGTTVLPFLITGTTITDTATDAAAFVFDTNQTADTFVLAQTKNGIQTGNWIANVPVVDTYQTVRVAIDSAGGARYYFNGIEMGYIPLAVTTTVGLVPYFGIKNLSAAVHIATLRYVRVWQDA